MSTKPLQRTCVRGRKVSDPGAVMLGLTFLAAVMLSSCGGGITTVSDTPNNPAPVSVYIWPATFWVDQGGTIHFSGSASGASNHSVTWSVQEGAAGGSISQTGLYNAPAAAMEVHIVATSVADPSKSASAVVTVNDVKVSMPSTAGLRSGQQRQFTAVVAGTVGKDVTWMVEEGASGGTITVDGVYTAPMSGGPFHVTARSVWDPSKAATVTVVLTSAGFRLLNTSTLQPRFGHTATLLPNGKVLIAGGRECTEDVSLCPPLSSAELFDPVTETFSATGSMSTGRTSHAAILLKNGTVMVTGGVNWEAGADTTAEVYNPATGGFTKVGNMAEGRAAHTASLLGDGRVLIAGGLGGNLYDWGFYAGATAEIYDPATQSFSRVGDMPDEAAYHTASVLLDGRVFVAGGERNSGPGRGADVTIFDAADNSFSVGVSLPTARARHTATTLNDGRVLITGGFDEQLHLILNTAVVYDPATLNYSPETTMREPRANHSATLLVDGKVLVVGSTAELFDPTTSSFAITGDPNVARADRRATRLADGRVLFTGSAAAAEIYE